MDIGGWVVCLVTSKGAVVLVRAGAASKIFVSRCAIAAGSTMLELLLHIHRASVKSWC